MKRVLLLALGFFALTAETLPRPGPVDPHIQRVLYNPEQVVALHGAIGWQIMIEFGGDERIENVSIGDSLGWQITPNRKASLLFLKPVARGARTNMTVITSLRRYAFDLSVRAAPRNDRDSIIFGLRFSYPAPVRLAVTPPPAPEPPRDVNHAYSYRGSGRDLPTRVFDDGRATYFAFAETTDYPAILALDGASKETMVNSAMRDGYVVVDQLAPAFVLRRGKEATTIINDGWREAAPGPLSPTPHKGSKR
jgi:type IV secretion system protein VirB9